MTTIMSEIELVDLAFAGSSRPYIKIESIHEGTPPEPLLEILRRNPEDAFPRQPISPATDPFDPSVEANDWDDKTNSQRRPTFGFDHNLREGLTSWCKKYGVLFSLVFALNIAALIWNFHQENASTVKHCESALTFVAVDVFLALLASTDELARLIYKLVSFVPRSWPVSVRRLIAGAYQQKGGKVGAICGAWLWAPAFAVLVMCPSGEEPSLGSQTIVITWVAIFSLLCTCGSLMPFAASLPGLFLLLLRWFCPLVSLFLLWALETSLTIALDEENAQQFGRALASSPAFYFLIFIPLLAILPWIRFRRIEVQYDNLSDQITRLYFPVPDAKHNTTLRISPNILSGWRKLATIPANESTAFRNDRFRYFAQSFSVLVRNTDLWNGSGEWDRRNLTKLWMRGILTTSAPQLAYLFQKVVFLCTGPGVGAVLSAAQACRVAGIKYHIIWAAVEPEKAYGEDFIREVLDADPAALCWDVRKKGTPDLVGIAHRHSQNMGAEAVIVVSGADTRKVTVRGLWKLGLSAYGADVEY